MSLKDLSRKYNIKVDTIRKWLKKYNVPLNATARFKQVYHVYKNYAEIELKHSPNNVFTQIDLEDVEKCKNKGIWSILPNGYVMHCGTNTYLHRFIYGDTNNEVDHIDRNPLNNRRYNLRGASSSQQKMNTKLRKDNISGHRGVYFDKSRNKWAVNIRNKEKRIGGRFDTYEDAVDYCEKGLMELHSEYLGGIKNI